MPIYGISPDAAPRPLLRGDEGHGARGSKRHDRGKADAGNGGGLRAGDDGDGDNRRRREATSVPPLKGLTFPTPRCTGRILGQALEAATRDTISRLRDGDGIFDQPSALEALTEEAMVVTYEQMKHTDPMDADTAAPHASGSKQPSSS